MSLSQPVPVLLRAAPMMEAGWIRIPTWFEGSQGHLLDSRDFSPSSLPFTVLSSASLQRQSFGFHFSFQKKLTFSSSNAVDCERLHEEHRENMLRNQLDSRPERPSSFVRLISRMSVSLQRNVDFHMPTSKNSIL
jgi:hypothetical protein